MDKRYRITGTDEDGDQWTFSTDDAERASAMLSQMREDLAEVELSEAAPA